PFGSRLESPPRLAHQAQELPQIFQGGVDLANRMDPRLAALPVASRHGLALGGRRPGAEHPRLVTPRGLAKALASLRPEGTPQDPVTTPGRDAPRILPAPAPGDRPATACLVTCQPRL